MSLTKITYSKDWTNPVDFPTIETSEAQVRADMQVLYDQAKTGVNTIVDQLEGTTGAGNIGVTPITGVTGTKVQGVLEDLKSQVDDKASSSTTSAHISNTSNPHSVTKAQVGLGNVDNTSDANKPVSTATATALALKETIAAADLLISNVTYTSSDGRFTFTKQGGSTIVIDTNLEKVPGSMALVEDPIGSGTYYLVIYDTSTPPQELSRCPVGALFNAINVEDTSTIHLVLASDTAGKKKLTANVIDGSVTFTKLDSGVQTRITTLESEAIDGVTDTSSIDLGISNHKITASVKAGGITAAMLEAGLYSDIEGFKTAAETAATNAATSESNASSYANNAAGSATTASGYADNASASATAASGYSSTATQKATEAAASAVSAGSSATTATTQATNAGTRAVNAGQWAVGPTKQASEEYGTPTDTNNAWYYMTQAAEIASGEGIMLKANYDSTAAVLTAGGIVPYVNANGGKIDHITVNGTEQTIVDKTVALTIPTALANLTDDATHRVVTDTEKSTWSGKQNTVRKVVLD